MKLENLLLEKRSAILDRWLDLIFGTYSKYGQSYFKKETDRFLNPVGYEFRKGVGGIYRVLLEGMDDDEVSSFLDKIIRIRAIQDFTPSQAVAFIFLLKKAIREELKTEVHKNELAEDLLVLEFKIDGLALLCFDMYIKRREQLYEIRIKDIKNRISGLLKATGLVHEIEQEELKLKADEVFI